MIGAWITCYQCWTCERVAMYQYDDGRYVCDRHLSIIPGESVLVLIDMSAMLEICDLERLYNDD